MRRVGRATLVAAVIVILLVAIAPGCASSIDQADRTATTTERPPVLRYRIPRTPEGTVLLLRRLVNAHSFPTAVDLYDTRVVEVMGRETLVGVLGAIAATVAAIHLLLIEKQPTETGITVILRGRIANKPVLLSYVMSQQHRRWHILYDSMINDALGPYVQGQVQATLDPGATRPSARAIAAGATAVQKYQRVVISSGAGISGE
jgi:hypothetical protein